MPSHGMRRSAPAGEWSTDAGRALDDPVTTSSSPVPPATRGGGVRAWPRKFTALLDADTDARFGQLLAELRGQVGPVATREDGSGRVRSGYDPSRADLLRALLVVAENSAEVRQAVYDQVRSHYGATA